MNIDYTLKTNCTFDQVRNAINAGRKIRVFTYSAELAQQVADLMTSRPIYGSEVTRFLCVDGAWCVFNGLQTDCMPTLIL